jgi:ferric-dicitrate binding protein FerR (iron transport regulator)
MNADWHNLIQQYLSGTISRPDAEALERQLKADADLRDWYLDALNLDTALANVVEAAEMTRALPVPPALQTLDAASRRQRSLWARTAVLAAAAVLIAALGVASLLQTQRSVWVELTRVSEDSSSGWRAGERIRARHLTWARGSVEMRLPSGVHISVDGPADLAFLSPMEIRLHAGKITADVGAGGKGFVIETPEARVVDLGTVFGVDATSAAKTDVVVFNGKVEVYEKGAMLPVALLSQGEGLRLERNRRTSRIVNVNGPDESGDWSSSTLSAAKAIITSVGDSMSADEEEAKQWPSLRNFYRIVPGGLREGALAFADTLDEWAAIPEELVGADQVRTFAVDRYNWWMTLTLQVSKPSELFVFIDRRNPVPHWVLESFVDTGKTVLLNFKPSQISQRVVAQYPYAVWSRKIETPGTVSLGAPYENPPEDRKSFRPNNMFGIAAKQLR